MEESKAELSAKREAEAEGRCTEAEAEGRCTEAQAQAWCTQAQAWCTEAQAWCTEAQAWCTQAQAWCTQAQAWCTQAEAEAQAQAWCTEAQAWRRATEQAICWNKTEAIRCTETSFDHTQASEAICTQAARTWGPPAERPAQSFDRAEADVEADESPVSCCFQCSRRRRRRRRSRRRW